MGSNPALAVGRGVVPDPRDRLIVALDVASAGDARSIVDNLDDRVSVYKVGWHLFMVPGADQLVTDLKNAGKQVFWDYKIGDINETVKGAIHRAIGRNIDFMTAMVNGPVMDAVRDREDTKILYVSMLTLTNMDDGDLRDIGVNATIPDLVRLAARRAVKIGCDGMIVSGQEVEDIRETIVGSGFVLVTPGIRPAGISVDDHKRASTPRDAILRGSDYLVVGRPIIKNDPAGQKSAADRILDEMQAAFDARG